MTHPIRRRERIYALSQAYLTHLAPLAETLFTTGALLAQALQEAERSARQETLPRIQNK